MSNVFDQFDATGSSGNAFDQFDAADVVSQEAAVIEEANAFDQVDPPQRPGIGEVISGHAKAGLLRIPAQVGGLRIAAGERGFQPLAADPVVRSALTKDVRLSRDDAAALPRQPGMLLPSAFEQGKALEAKRDLTIDQFRNKLPEVRKGKAIYDEYSQLANEARPKNVDPDSVTRYVGEATEALIGNVLPGLAVGIATRSPNAAMALMTGQVYGDKYASARKDGRTPEQSQMDATFYAASEVIPERIPLGIALSQGGKVLTKILKTAGAEGVQEIFTEALQIGYDTGVVGKETDLKTALRQIVDAGIVGAMVGGGMATVAAPFNRRPAAKKDEQPEVLADGNPFDQFDEGQAAEQPQSESADIEAAIQGAQPTPKPKSKPNQTHKLKPPADTTGKASGIVDRDTGEIVPLGAGANAGLVRDPVSGDMVPPDQARKPGVIGDPLGLNPTVKESLTVGNNAATTASIPVMITKKMGNRLLDLGYSAKEIRALTPQQAHDLIGSGISKPSATLPSAETPPSNNTPHATESVPQEPVQAHPEGLLFTTGKGSTYVLHPDGTTTRNKAARKEHPGDSGLKTRSQSTFYIDDISALNPTGLDSSFAIIDHGDGTLSMSTKNIDGKWGIAPGSRNIPVSSVPEVGKHPIEVWKNDDSTAKKYGVAGFYRGTHPGNKITEITRPLSPMGKDASTAQASVTATPEPAQAQIERSLFTPTHEASDGTPVIPAEGQPGVWVDATGMEIEDQYATPISKRKPGGIQNEKSLQPQVEAAPKNELATGGNNAPVHPLQGEAARQDKQPVTPDVYNPAENQDKKFTIRQHGKKSVVIEGVTKEDLATVRQRLKDAGVTQKGAHYPKSNVLHLDRKHETGIRQALEATNEINDGAAVSNPPETVRKYPLGSTSKEISDKWLDAVVGRKEPTAAQQRLIDAVDAAKNEAGPYLRGIGEHVSAALGDYLPENIETGTERGAIGDEIYHAFGYLQRRNIEKSSADAISRIGIKPDSKIGRIKTSDGKITSGVYVEQIDDGGNVHVVGSRGPNKLKFTLSGDSLERAISRANGTDLLGDDTAKAQAVADATQAKEDKRNGTKDVPVDSGEFFGQGGKLEADLFDKSTGEFANNKIFTADKVEAARARLKKKLGQLNSGIDPEVMVDGMTIAGAYIESGVRDFEQFAKTMAGDFGDSIKPYLLSFWEGARNYPGLNAGDMTGVAESAKVHAELMTAVDAEPAKQPDADVTKAKEALQAAGVTGKELREAIKDVRKGDLTVAEVVESLKSDDSAATLKGKEDSQHVDVRKDNLRDDQGAGPAETRRDGADDGAAGRDVAISAADQQGGGGGRTSGSDSSRSTRSVKANPGDAAGGKRGKRGGTAKHSGGSERALQQNYRITGDSKLGQGGPLERARGNLAAIHIVKSLAAEKRLATPEEQAELIQYVGWGASGIKNSLFPTKGEPTGSWKALQDELKAVLTEDEYKTALRSTQYAHYTSKTVIDSIYSAIASMGVRSGMVFEGGMGTGNFVGLIPDSMRLRYTGVEMDGISAAVAKALYPEAGVVKGDFTKFGLPDNHFDVTIGNPPFSSTVIKNDPKYRAAGFMLHDYFIAKQIDALKPGGIGVFVTSKGTMDKADSKAREYVAERANLLGAIRLPQTAFKEHAGTEVVTDILLFQKKGVGVADTGHEWLNVREVQTPDGPTSINEYFARRKEMILGESRLTGSQYRENEYTVVPTGEIEAMLSDAIKRLPANIVKENPTSEELDERAKRFELNPGNPENSFYLSDSGEIRSVADGVGVAVPVRGGDQKTGLSKKQAEIIRDYIPLRDAVMAVYREQFIDGNWKAAQKELHKAYDAFVANHGAINQVKIVTRKDGIEMISEPVISTIDMDPEAYRVAGIERYDEATNRGEKNAIFSERVVGTKKVAEIENATDALNITLNDRGYLDMEYLLSKYGQAAEDVISELGEAVFKDPSSGHWATADDYLSGNVKAKLAVAKSEAETTPEYRRNIEALEQVQPEDLPVSRIPANLGAMWIPDAVITKFAEEFIDFEGKITSQIHGDASAWIVEGNSGDKIYSTGRRDATEILHAALNKSMIKVYDVSGSGKDKTTTLNVAETTAANQKAQEMKEKFAQWAISDADSAETLHQIYNSDFNTMVPRKYNGAHLKLPRLSDKYKLHPWQMNGVWRILQNGNTYMAHTVGAGKTLVSAVAGIELKRLGLANKPTYVVLKATLKQFATELLDAYPDAKILVADEKQLDKANRRRFMGKLVNDDWDAVIMTHEAFEKIPMSDEFMTTYIEGQLTEYRDILEGIDESERGPRSRIEKQIENLENKLAAATNQEKKDQGITFEESGIDFLFVDEAHHHKKIPFPTNQSSIKGVSSEGSGKAQDLYMKSIYLNQVKPGKNMVLMSGTPVTNTLGEVFNIQRYLQPDVLERNKISSFDAWTAMFADTVTELEMQAGGDFKPSTRLAKFVGVPALLRDFLRIADIVTDGDLNNSVSIKRPTVKDGQRQIVAVPRSQSMIEYQEELSGRIAALEDRKGPPKKGEDNILVVIGDAKKAAIDMRMVGREQTGQSKLDVMIDNVADSWKRTKGDQYRSGGKIELKNGSTQLIFTELRNGAGFDVYEHIRTELVKRGVKADEIAFIQDATNTNKKKRLFRDMNTGVKRILLGGSKNMGTGVNVQQRLVEIHHLDIDYLPSNIVQREGRGIRQGNKNSEISIKAYATEGTVDAFMWQLNETKQRMIDQVMGGDLSIDEVEDVSDSVNQMAMAKALSSGNPMLLELAGLTAEVKKLENLRHAFYNQKHQNRKDLEYTNGRLKELAEIEPKLKALAAKYKETKGDSFSATINGKRYDERTEAGERLIALLEGISKESRSRKIGELGGYDLYADNKYGDAELYITDMNSIYGASNVVLSPRIPLPKAENMTAVGLMRTIENAASKVSKAPDLLAAEIVAMEKKKENLAKGIGGEFQYDADLKSKRARLDDVKHALETGKADKGMADEDKVPVSNEAAGQYAIRKPARNRENIVHSDRLTHPVMAPTKGTVMGVRQVIASTVLSWGQNAPDIQVVQSIQDLPAHLRPERRVSLFGVHDPSSGAVYLIADNLGRTVDVRTILAHEAIGHYAMEEMLGDTLMADAVKRVQWLKDAGDKTILAVADEVARDYGRLDSTTESKEIIAKLAERRELKSKFAKLYESIMSAMRKFLRKIGFNVMFSNKDIDAILADAERWLKQDGGKRTQRDDALWHRQLGEIDLVMGDGGAYGASRWVAAHPEVGADIGQLVANAELIKETSTQATLKNGAVSFDLIKRGDRWRLTDAKVGANYAKVPGVTVRQPWGEFPPVQIQADLGAASKHVDYAAAKAGDVHAAVRLVTDIVSDASLQAVRVVLAGRKPVVVPVVALEATGRNKIPLAYAEVLAKRLGLKTDTGIVQTNRVNHTNAGAYHRIVAQALFDGEITPGQEYLIVDDTLTMGGTLAALKGHIESNGGKVIVASTLTGFKPAANIAIQPKMLAKLRGKYGGLEQWWKNEFGFGFDSLTQGEAGRLLQSPDADAFRSRIIEARRQAGIATDQADSGQPLAPGAETTDSSQTPAAGVSYAKRGDKIGGMSSNDKTNDNLTEQKPLKPESEISLLNDVARIVKSSKKPVFVRWSSSEDMEPGKVSRDYVAGSPHTGLSAVPLTPDMTNADIAKYLNEYGFLRMKGDDIRPRLYTGDVVGTDSDGYPSIRPTKIIGTLSDSFIAELDNNLAKRLALEESIADDEFRLQKITNPIAREIVESYLAKNKSELEKLNPNPSQRPPSAGDDIPNYAIRKTANSKPDRYALNPDNDSLLQSIAKRGGISAAEAERVGIPKGVGGRSGVFGKPFVRAKGGLPFDDIVRHLVKSGYIPKGTADAHALVLDKITKELQGEKSYTKQGAIAAGNRKRMGKKSAEPKSAQQFIDELAMTVPTRESMGTRIKESIGGKLADMNKEGEWLRFMTRQHLAEWGERWLPHLPAFENLARDMDAARNERIVEAAEIAKPMGEWARKQQADYKAMSALAHEATIEGVDPSEPFTLIIGKAEGKQKIKTLKEQAKLSPGEAYKYVNQINEITAQMHADVRREAAYPGLVKKWSSLTPEAQRYYTMVRDAYSKRLLETEAALAGIADRAVISENERRVMKTKIREHFESMRVQGPYFPLSRPGDYWVEATKGDPESDDYKRVVLPFEKYAEMQQAVKKLKLAGWEVRQGEKIQKVKALGGASEAFVDDVISLLDGKVGQAVRDDIYQLWLTTMPELSMRKHFIHRNKVEGYDDDMIRAFADNMFHGAYQIAKMEYADRLADLLKKMDDAVETSENPTKAGRYFAEIQKRYEWLLNPQAAAWTSHANSLGFAYYLGLTPAAAMVNAMQTPLIAFPVLGARFGFAKAAKELGKANNEFFRGVHKKGAIDNIKEGMFSLENKLTGQELDYFQRFQRAGGIDKTMTHDLIGQAESISTIYSGNAAKAQAVIGYGFHHVERYNREITFLAAFRMSMQKHSNPERAYAEAADLTWKSHYDYSNANKARFMQGNIARVVFMFRQYSLNTTMLLVRSTRDMLKGESKEVRKEGAKQLAAILVMTQLAAGALGLPWVWDIMELAFQALQALFGDDDDPEELQTVFINFLSDHLPETAVKALGFGLGNAAGVDLHSRVGLNNLWLREGGGESLDGGELFMYKAAQLTLGPLGGIGANVAEGISLINDGKMYLGIEKMMPKAFRDVMKAYRYADEGVTNRRGDTIVNDIHPGEISLQAIGFTPGDIAFRYEANRALNNRIHGVLDRRQHLMDRYLQAKNAEDQSAIDEWEAAINTFNEKNPENGISDLNIRRAQQGRDRRTGTAVNGIYYNRNSQHFQDDVRFGGE